MLDPVRFIAEVSSNHNQDLARCLRFVDKAAEIGCYAVKFQYFRIDELFAPEVLQRSAAHRRRKLWELPVQFLPDIAKRCQDKGLQFVCTPFFLDGVDQLKGYIDSYKIASYELLWDALLERCGKSEKPVILSTGMADRKEIDHAVQVLRKSGCRDLTLLHCVSGYPAPIDECNLAFIKYLQGKYECPVGWSDHSRSPAVIYRAVHRWDAAVVEFHLDLDGSGAEYIAGHCWLPSQAADVIDTVNRGLIADGDGRLEVMKCEAADRDWRADPYDGLRPLRRIRKSLTLGEQAQEGNDTK